MSGLADGEWQEAAVANTQTRLGSQARDPEQTVRALFEAALHQDEAALAAVWAEDAVWHNMPAMPVRGRKKITRIWMGMFRFVERFEVELRHVAVAGDVVMTERIDRLVVRGVHVPIAVSGTFIVRDGEIVENREYWDWLATGKAFLKALMR
jgi:limonene-1,2-epoxide hydrolase